MRVSAAGSDDQEGSAQARVDEAAAIVLERLGDYVWAEGDTTWSSALGTRLGERGWRLALEEIGTAGQMAVLLGDVDWLAFAEVRPATGFGDDEAEPLLDRARRVREVAGVEVGLAVRVRPRGSELAVSIAIVTPTGERRQTRTTYTGGSVGRSQAALLAAATLSTALGDR